MKIDRNGAFHGEDGKYISKNGFDAKSSQFEKLKQAERIYNTAYPIDINSASRYKQENEIFVSREEYVIISSEVMRKRAQHIRKNKTLRGIIGVYTADFFYYVRVKKYGFSIVKRFDIESKDERASKWREIEKN